MLEIGTEELPAAYLPDLIDQLRREAEALLQAHHLAFRAVESFGGPRRLVLLVRGLDGVQRKPAQELRGPSKAAAYDGQGSPTPALAGFLRAQGGAPARVKIVTSPKGEYVYLVKPPTTTPTVKVLPGLLTQLVGTLRAPKTMRWDASNLRFARPIRWLLALYGSAPVRCAAGRLISQPKTWVGQPLRPKALAVTSVDGYVRALKKSGTILDQTQRRAWIERAVNRIATQARGRPSPEMVPPPVAWPEARSRSNHGRRRRPATGGGMVSHGLLDEVVHLVERPVALAGTFDRKYLELPRDVLLASMAKYQRVFAIETTQGTPLPTFIGILEGKPGKPAVVQRVFERILNARLADSLLFWNQDRARSLEQMAQDLAGVTFHEQWGSMQEKSRRLSALSTTLADAWQLTSQDRADLQQACGLAKADLVSTMVKEFPTLQGVMGKHYAKHDGMSSVVADALEEQYLPAGTRLPKTLIGSALAILEKYDTLTCYFTLGIEPTGNQDPFGLRRAAQGIVEVAWKVHRPLPFDALFDRRQTLAISAQTKPTPQTGERVRRYLLERLYTFSWPTAPSVDCIDAVLASPCGDLVDAMDRVVSLRRLTGQPGLLKAAKVIERTRNILKGGPPRQTQVDPDRLTEPLEHALWNVYRTHAPRVSALIERKSYAEATALFGDLFYQPLHEFFDHVLVNAPEATTQQNRLALMQAINTLYTARIADLSKLTVLQQHTEELSS